MKKNKKVNFRLWITNVILFSIILWLSFSIFPKVIATGGELFSISIDIHAYNGSPIKTNDMTDRAISNYRDRDALYEDSDPIVSWYAGLGKFGKAGDFAQALLFLISLLAYIPLAFIAVWLVFQDFLYFSKWRKRVQRRKVLQLQRQKRNLNSDSVVMVNFGR